MKCIILAAGAGTRLNTNKPKALHKISFKPMLERILNTLGALKIKDIVVVTGFGHEQVNDFLKRYRIKTVKQKKLLGSADAVKTAQKHIGASYKGDTLILYTDTPLISRQAITKLIKTHKKFKPACTLLTALYENPAGYGRIVRDNKGSVVEIIEEKDADIFQKKIKEVNTGVYCFNNRHLFNYLKTIKKNRKKGEFYLTDIIKKFNEKKLKVKRCLSSDFNETLGINSRLDLSKADSIIRQRKITRLMEQGVTFIDPFTAYISDETQIEKDTVIHPCVYIEGRVKIGKNCQIGPFARVRGTSKIGNNSVVGNFVEVVRTEIGHHTRVKHHTYLGDAKIGNYVNVGAGVITANYDGKAKHTTTVKDKAFIGVGAVLIAPVVIGKSALVGAGSVVSKNKNVPDKTVVVGVPARPFIKKTVN